MKLRPKLAVTLVAIVIPVLVVFTLFRISAERRAFRERTAERVAARLEARAPGRCLRDPESFHLNRRGFQIYGYGPDYRSANPQAPPLPGDVVEALRAGEETASASFWRRSPYAGVSAVGTQWEDSPCSALAVFWPHHVGRGPGRFARDIALQTFVAFMVLLLTALIAAGPIVRRIRRLTEAIEEAGGPDYQVKEETDADDEIGELARAFNTAGERVSETVSQLEARDRALTEYIANTTHDLAIPLTVLQHRLSKLQKQLEASDDRALADAAMEEAHYIAALITNMGAAARLDRTGEELTVHPCDLCELVERVVSRFEPLAEQKEIELNWAVPPERLESRCDSTLVEQALSNFVQNAIQYNSAGGHISVLLEDARPSDGRGGFELRVLDDGPGVPEELLARLTERSFRMDESRTRQPGGQGFGLSIAQRVVELHGWSLKLQNGAEGGLEVVVSA
ncbi:HAMP domain-containing sensor histidine kinase [Bradymonas sediminis]|uniref:histidine kinase n=1 Tax=Bradymonas sediminis TaxID=1548548 RepID=A0A2Z4FQ23_9DELT|nr:HAMP domain-containing sensor histidine kinase [Bradymonas sediminis]AWV91020.1 sensor histidine kinase [Bradymonas sediminis]TDP75238.1 signal transduction histidine kinase [Bradymonas sediminis]